MKKATLFGICILFIAGSTQAQRIQFTDVSVFTGYSASSSTPYSESAMLSLNNNFNLPSFTSNSNYNYGLYNYMTTNQTGVMAGFTLRKLPQNTHRFRIGISGSSTRIGWTGFQGQTDNYRYDTLVSSRTGEEVYIDSIHSKNLNYGLESQAINVFVQYLRTINPRNKLSAYAGGGLNFGGAISTKLRGQYNEYSYVAAPVQNNSYGTIGDYTSESQTQNLENLQNFNVHTILGLNYRFSNRTVLLRNLNIFAEGNLGLDYTNSSESNSKMGFSRGVNVGLRVTFPHPRNSGKRRER